MAITYLNMFPDEDELKAIRKALYHSDGPGYYEFENFLNPEFTEHMVQFWTKEVLPERTHVTLKEFVKSETFYKGCPNYYYPNNYGHAFYNYVWNKPVDEVTYAVSIQILLLRNFVENKNFYNDIYPIDGLSSAHRVVITKNGTNIVAPHSDWVGDNFDPARLQATLILTEKGKDYSGTGMTLKSNDGKKTWVFGKEIAAKPGTLVLWRYNNEHSVQDVSSKDDQKGFIRMIFPPEKIFEVPDKVMLDKFRAGTLMKTAMKRLGRKFKGA